MAFSQTFNTGPRWTNLAGTNGWVLFSGDATAAQVYNPGMIFRSAGVVLCPDQGSANQSLEFALQQNIAAARGDNFIAGRVVDGNNFIGVRCLPSVGLELVKVVGGVDTVLISGVDTTIGVPQRVEFEGDKVRWYSNGVLNGTEQTVTEHQTATRQGFVGRTWLNEATFAYFTADVIAADVTAPVLTSPTGTATGATTASGSVTTDESGGTLFAVVTTSATGPTVTQIKAGQDHTGAAAAFAVGSGAGQAVSATGAQAVSATGLTTDVAGHWHFVHTDAAGNNSNVVSSAAFTPTSTDLIAPIFSVAPSVSSVAQTSATFTATIDETGDIFYVVVPQAAANPTPAEVVAGQSSGGGSPILAGSVLAGASINAALSGLSSNTPYKVVTVARDDEGTPNVQASVTVVSFTTSAAGAALTMVSPTNAANDPLTAQNIIVMVASATTGVAAMSPVTVAYSSGSLVVNSASLSAGTTYVVTMINAAGEVAVAKATAT